MTPQELAELLYGPTNPPVAGEAGVTDQPVDLPAPPVGQPGNTGSGGASVDFAPVTQDLYGLTKFVPPTGGSVGVSQSQSGYSPQKMDQIEAGPMGSKKMAKGREAIEQRVRSNYSPVVKGMEQANAAQLVAESELGLAEAAQIRAKAEGQGRISALHDQHLNDFKRLNESALIAKQQAKDEYRQRLLEIPQLNPNALWDEAGSAGQFQMGVAAFVHDMLGVKGIKTSAMDTINQAIQNKIQAQITNINTKKEVASGFRDLYEMTVRESASQEEAQAKMQGYMLKAMESGIDATMGSYDANVARAKHQQAKMVLRQAQLKNMAEVEAHINAGIDRAYEQEIQIRGQNMTAATARENRKVDLEIARLKAGADKASQLGPVIYDQTKSGGGAAKFRIKGVYKEDKELVRDVSNKVVNTAQAVDALRELNEIQAKIDGGTAPELLGKLRTERDRLEAAARGAVVWALTVDVAGKRATDTDYERISAMVPEKGWFTNGNNRRIISQLISSKLKETNKTLGQFTDDIQKDDPAYGTRSAQGTFGAGELEEANMNKSGEDVHDPSAVERLSKQAQSPDGLSNRWTGDKFEEGEGSYEESEFKQFTLPYWQDYKKGQGDWTKGDNPVLQGNPTYPPKAFDAVRELAEMAHDGDNDALIELHALANKTPRQGGSDSDFTSQQRLASMADYFIDKLNKLQPNENVGLNYAKR